MQDECDGGSGRPLGIRQSTWRWRSSTRREQPMSDGTAISATDAADVTETMTRMWSVANSPAMVATAPNNRVTAVATLMLMRNGARIA